MVASQNTKKKGSYSNRRKLAIAMKKLLTEHGREDYFKQYKEEAARINIE